MNDAAGLFSELEIRSVRFRNRIAVSPMCQYSCEDGFANDWHVVHLGSRAIGGAALVFTEAAAVEDRGRISHSDLGLWKDEHIDPLARISRFIKQNGAVPGMQIAHAGRKASTDIPWLGGKPLTDATGAWKPVGPSAIPFSPQHQVPAELSKTEIREIIGSYVSATRRAVDAGFEVLEIHAAHGYLAHEFLSPLSNSRTDEYGGSLQARMLFTRQLIEAVRKAWPERLPLFLRISATDWIEGGWTADDSVELARAVKGLGIDLIDCSSGGTSLSAKIPLSPGYQVPFADRIRREAGIATGAVGLITEPEQADSIIRLGQADLVLLAREFLRDPYWPIHAAQKLGVEPVVPPQYQRAYINPRSQGSR